MLVRKIKSNWPATLCAAVAVVACGLSIVGASVAPSRVGSEVLKLLWREQESLLYTSVIFAIAAICIAITTRQVRAGRFGLRDAMTVGLALVGSLGGMVLSGCYLLSGLRHEKYLYWGIYGTLALTGLGILIRWYAAAVEPIPGSRLRPWVAGVLFTTAALLIALIVAAAWILAHAYWV